LNLLLESAAFYAYARGNPISRRDPLGLCAGDNNSPVVAQEIPFIDPLLEAIKAGKPVSPEDFEKVPDFKNETGQPEPLQAPPDYSPQDPWWIQFWKFIGGGADKINGVDPTAPPVCTHCAPA
jgi:hypothetical protein